MSAHSVTAEHTEVPEEAPATQASPVSEAQSRPAAPRRRSAIPRAQRPGDVPSPEHHHLPGWVRRAFLQARPVLADALGQLEGEPREQLARQISEVTQAINGGKFSAAWQYPELVAQAETLFDQHRRQIAEGQKERRTLDAARRKVSDQLRDASATLPGDAASRLGRALRSATGSDEIRAVEVELNQTALLARSSQDKRRDREIERTRARIERSTPRSQAAQGQSESWQDVLRRLADEQGVGPGEE